MILYLLRHAKAIPRQGGVSDEQRYLTTEGRELFTRIAVQLREQGMQPELILTSPLLRSVQTAEILAGTLAFPGPLLVEPLLAPGFGRRQLARLLKKHGGVGEMVLVGHEPDLSLLVTVLLGVRAHFTLKKGDLVAMELDPEGKAGFCWRTFRGEFTGALLDREDS
jgi:phosphohistidine phosphatase